MARECTSAWSWSWSWSWLWSWSRSGCLAVWLAHCPSHVVLVRFWCGSGTASSATSSASRPASPSASPARPASPAERASVSAATRANRASPASPARPAWAANSATTASSASPASGVVRSVFGFMQDSGSGSAAAPERCFFQRPHGPAQTGIGSLAPHGWRSGTSGGMQASMSLQSPPEPISPRTIEFQRARCAAGARHGLFIGQAQSAQAPLQTPDPRWHTQCLANCKSQQAEDRRPQTADRRPQPAKANRQCSCLHACLQQPAGHDSSRGRTAALQPYSIGLPGLQCQRRVAHLISSHPISSHLDTPAQTLRQNIAGASTSALISLPRALGLLR
jgi:hypothetical protein